MFKNKNNSELKKAYTKKDAIIKVAFVLVALLLVNILVNFTKVKFDLTEDKRYTITPSTKEMVTALKDPVVVEVLLEGELPGKIQRLKEATQEMLQELHEINPLFEYRFIDPLEGENDLVKQNLLRYKEVGIVPLTVRIKEKGEMKDKMVFPYATITYGQQKPQRVDLIENRVGQELNEWLISSSINLLEYKFANTVQKLQYKEKPIVAFTAGHGELDSMQLYDLKNTLAEFYAVGDINLDVRPSIDYYGKDDTTLIDVLVVAKPTRPFTDQQKFKIDQYIMRGGKVLWLIDALNASMDSLKGGMAAHVPIDIPHNLDDQLFRYGARVNPNLIVDVESSKIPIVVGMMGNEPQIELKSWWYYPIATGNGINHPIVKSMNGVDTRFPSSIDTIKTKAYVKKTPLLTSSRYSKLQFAPTRVSFDIMGIPVQPDKFDKPHETIALLLEGTFSSLFQNRVSAEMDSMLRVKLNMPYRPESVPTKMIVVADGDIAANDVETRFERPKALPLGFNRFEKYTYGNKDFVLNSIEYLLDKKGIVAARSKEIKLRPLNAVNAKDDASFWKAINMVVPILLLAVFGLVYNYIRNRRFSR